MQWFEIKEQAAGKKRIIISWYLYKIFGKNILYFIAFLVSFFTFLFAPKIRNYSKKYFNVIKNYIEIKPSLFNQFKHIYSYAFSLVDKMLVFCGDYDINKINFDKNKDKEELLSDINNKKGVFLIFSHIGNIEVLESFLLNKKLRPDFKINIFISNKQSQIFNDFLKTIKLDFPIKIFPVEDINPNTGVELEENLKHGDIVFIAGDRLSQDNNKCIISNLYSKKISLPKGTFRLAKIINVPTYFISSIKIKNEYKIYLEKQKSLKEQELVQNYVNFLKKGIETNPFQFFHFYDFFN